MTQIDQVIEDIKAAFGVEDEQKLEVDLESVFDLTILEDRFQIGHLGEILLGLSSMRVTGHADYRMVVTTFADQLSLASQYAGGSRLYGVEKITGRTLMALIGSLSIPQRRALMEWVKFVVADDQSFYEDEVPAMKEVEAWLSSL
jgi:hypothetical protein